ncbi:hypothetical protein AAVH_19184, partial [Aphelenchoides avenae]
MHEHVEFEVFRWCDRATLECSQLVNRRLRNVVDEHAAALPMRRISSVSMENADRNLMRAQCECNPTQAVITGADNHSDDFDVAVILLDDAGVQKLMARLRNAYVEHLRLACTCSRLLRAWVEHADPKCNVGWLHVERYRCRPTGVVFTQPDSAARLVAERLRAGCFHFGWDMDRSIDDDFGIIPFIHAQSVKAVVKRIAFPWLSSSIPSSLIRYLFTCTSLQSCYVSATGLGTVNSWVSRFIE